MTLWRPELAVISDISTNIFAVFILILVIMLDLSRSAAPPGQTGSPPAAIDAARDLRLVERAPLRATEMVELLRRNPREALVIDLFESRIEVTMSGAASPLVLDARRDGARAVLDRFETTLRGSGRAPARLYVFSNRWYAPVADRLSQAGMRWDEISVPLALRSQAGARDAWSEAYLQLVARALDQDRFRLALARLLAGSAETGEGLGRSFGPGAGADAPPAGAAEGSLLARVARWLGILAAIGALTLGVGTVLLTERKFPRSIPLAKIRH